MPGVTQLGSLTATDTVLRRQKDGSVTCPENVILHMGGVDRGDQFQLRGCRIKSRKFYKYVYYFLFDVAPTYYILHKDTYYTKNKEHTIHRFRLPTYILNFRPLMWTSTHAALSTTKLTVFTCGTSPYC